MLQCRNVPKDVQKAKDSGNIAALSRMGKKGAIARKRSYEEIKILKEDKRKRDLQDFYQACLEANYDVCPPCDEDDPMYETYINCSQPQ